MMQRHADLYPGVVRFRADNIQRPPDLLDIGWVIGTLDLRNDFADAHQIVHHRHKTGGQ